MTKDWEALSMHWEAKAKQLEAQLAAAEARAEAVEREKDKTIERCNGHFDKWQDETRKAEARAEALRVALEEYADTANWYVDRESHTPCWTWLGGDPTAIAQAALSPADEQPAAAESEEEK